MCNVQSKICQVQRRVKQKKLVCKPQLLGWHSFGVDYKGGGLKPLLVRSLPHCQTLQGTGAVTSSLSCDRQTPVNLHSEINQMLASCKCSNNFDWVSLRRISFWCWHVNIKLPNQQWSYYIVRSKVNSFYNNKTTFILSWLTFSCASAPTMLMQL